MQCAIFRNQRIKATGYRGVNFAQQEAPPLLCTSIFFFWSVHAPSQGTFGTLVTICSGIFQHVIESYVSHLRLVASRGSEKSSMACRCVQRLPLLSQQGCLPLSLRVGGLFYPDIPTSIFCWVFDLPKLQSISCRCRLPQDEANVSGTNAKIAWKFHAAKVAH